jgi:hypothetical protein
MHHLFKFVKLRFVSEIYIIDLVIDDECVAGFVLVVGCTFLNRETGALIFDGFCWNTSVVESVSIATTARTLQEIEPSDTVQFIAGPTQHG